MKKFEDRNIRLFLPPFEAWQTLWAKISEKFPDTLTPQQLTDAPYST
jgi:hypothetical protein